MPKYTEIGQRLREFGIASFGSVSGLAKALGMRPQTLNNYLSGNSRPGGIIQGRLRDIGCDVDWLMTGSKKEDAKFPDNVLVSFSGKPSPAVLKRIQKLAEWMSKASEEDVKMLEQVARKILRSEDKGDND